MREHEWWKEFHEPEMADLFLLRADPRELADTIDFLTAELQLTPGSPVFDQCCGVGSLSIELARSKIRPIGVDLTHGYIQRAQCDAQRAGVECDFCCADAFEFVTPIPCRAAFNWYSSFGYSRFDERNQQMLQRAFDSLEPGGRFALDVPHLPGLLRSFQKRILKKGESNGRQVELTRDCFVKLQEGLLEQVWTWVTEGVEPRVRRSALRLYLPHQIAEMLATCGFEQVRLVGSVQGESLSLDSPRLICLARKPGP